MKKHTTHPSQPELPYPKLCECGCGQLTVIPKWNDKGKGQTKGVPLRFIRGHNRAGSRPRPIADKFWEKVDRRSPDECWFWKAKLRCEGGYGRVGKKAAHRVSWELHNGPIPDGLWVLHKCDVNYPTDDVTYRRCVNPAHLFLGTPADNSTDMVNKGRQAQGERSHKEKLKEADIYEIRKRYANGETFTSIARDKGINRTTVSRVVKRKIWKHL